MLLGTGENFKGTRTGTIERNLRNQDLLIFQKKSFFKGKKLAEEVTLVCTLTYKAVFITVFKAEQIKSNTNSLSSIGDTMLEEFVVTHPTLGHCRMVLGVRPCN